MASKSKSLNIRISPDLFRQLKEEARLQDSDLSEMIRNILDQYVVSQGLKREYDAQQ
jgi:predicted HicB family RNase H-like nuclease